MRGFVFIASLLWLFSSSLSAAPIYKWVDAQGVTHFSAQPHNQEAVEQINTPIFQPKMPEAAATADALDQPKTQAEIDYEVRQQVAKETAELQKYCTELRYNLAHLENNPRLLIKVDGQAMRLNEEERQARIAEIKQELSTRCAQLK